MNRRAFLQRSLTTAAAVAWAGQRPVLAADPNQSWDFQPDQHIVPAPKEPSQWLAFQQKLAAWREETRRKLGYDDSLYRKPEFAWAASAFSCCFVMMCDEMFYNPRQGAYTPDEFLAHGLREFGGYDSLVLWHAYPRIGVDDRNQFDFYRDMPGGLTGLRRVVEAIQRRGVRVFINYNPWDTDTRREGKPDLDVLCELVSAINADGIFLDTMNKGAAEFRAKLDATRAGVILEGEGALPLENLHDHHASWAQWFSDSEVPGVLRNKWFERRHIQHQIKRWETDHTGELHCAWMNGSGMMVWENVFGSWVPWSAHDRSILRSMLPIQRRFAGVFAGEWWTPLVPVEQDGVFASLWEGEDTRLWTLVNRGAKAVSGIFLKVPAKAQQRCFDLIAGREFQPRDQGGQWLLEGSLPPRGIAGFLAAPTSRLGDDFAAFLSSQAAIHARADFDQRPPRRETRLVSLQSTRRVARVPEGMVEVPAATLELVIEIRTRECGLYESMPPAGHNLAGSYKFATQQVRRSVNIQRFAIDVTPVTNAQFAGFLKATGYRPEQPENFLRHWNDGRPPAGKEDHPVVYVDLNDARAYARWTGRRLPTEEEWQYAAQGADGRRYPWGNTATPGRSNDSASGTTTPATAYLQGRSPFGCYDMCGNVWQWTESERTDGRTRFCIIRGGSFFTARGSGWYVDGGLRPANFATKFLLMWPGLDRCATIGFRCAADLGR